jgi:hypothetical protein
MRWLAVAGVVALAALAGGCSVTTDDTKTVTETTQSNPTTAATTEATPTDTAPTTSISAPSPKLGQSEAERNARTFASHVADQADDDGYEFEGCSRISRRQINCEVVYFNTRSDYTTQCFATIFVKLRAGTIYRGHKHEPDCQTSPR